MSARLRHIIFDCDGTLVDSQNIICAAMERAFSTVDRPAPERSQTLSIVGLSLPQAMAIMAPDADEAERERLVVAYKAAFVALRADTTYHEPLFPGARTAVDRLVGEPGSILSMATGKSRRGVAAILALHDMENVFQSVHTADDGPSKPHPHMIHSALAGSGIAPDRAVMVGDTTYDIEMALAAGAIPIGVDWGYHPAEALRAAGAARVISVFDELAEALDALVPV